MALLTADEVFSKKFQPTKFREGYDQDEVDDFLDLVVGTLRALYSENDELKAKLARAEQELAAANGGQSAPDATAQMEPVAPTPEPEVAASPEPEPEPEPEPQAAPAAPAPAAPQSGNEPEAATAMLALAQQLHDQYVRDGQAEADRLVNEARSEAERVTKETEDQRTRTLNQLEGERSLLERKIDELRLYERDYRARLKTYLENLLGELEGRGKSVNSSDAGNSLRP